MPRTDPYRTYSFQVEIDGIRQAGFSECTRVRVQRGPHRVPGG